MSQSQVPSSQDSFTSELELATFEQLVEGVSWPTTSGVLHTVIVTVIQAEFASNVLLQICGTYSQKWKLWNNICISNPRSAIQKLRCVKI